MRGPQGNGSRTFDESFVEFAEATLDEMLEASPVQATALGEHRYDDRLDDLRPAALEEERRRLSGRLNQLDALDLGQLSPQAAVDAATLRTRLAARLFALEQEREPEWNPLVANPGVGIYLLLARDFAPLADRLAALAGRLAGVPESLDMARRALADMPRVHVETAIVQFEGTRSLLTREVEEALAREPGLRGRIGPVRDRALGAVEDHLAWLRAQVEQAAGEPRIGAERFARKLELTLDTASDAQTVLARAEEHLQRGEQELAEAAAAFTRQRADSPELVRTALDEVAAQNPADDTTILPLCARALGAATQFVHDTELVTVYDDPVEILEMPEIHRGVAVAYCDPPGPLEPRALPTFFAVAPTPRDWPAERVSSFYREYNGAQLLELTVHEAMPGHMLQLAHARRARLPTRVRQAFWSGSFVEGWAVYAEALMSERGHPGPGPSGAAVRLQQAKMRLRMTINAILDARVHAEGMSRDEAMRLMTEHGYQEEGEAVGKWRRALLTSAQLSTYFVGYVEVDDLVRDLRAARPGGTERQLHDEILGHGSPAPRHLRRLLLPGTA